MGKSISDAMTSNPCAIETDKSVAYAAKMMRDEDVGFAPIVEGDRLVGALTDRDIAVKVVAEGRDPEQTSVREVASTNLVTVDSQQDLDEALASWPAIRCGDCRSSRRTAASSASWLRPTSPRKRRRRTRDTWSRRFLSNRVFPDVRFRHG